MWDDVRIESPKYDATAGDEPAGERPHGPNEALAPAADTGSQVAPEELPLATSPTSTATP
jgi:hypothetical protein